MVDVRDAHLVHAPIEVGMVRGPHEMVVNFEVLTTVEESHGRRLVMVVEIASQCGQEEGLLAKIVVG